MSNSSIDYYATFLAKLESSCLKYQTSHLRKEAEQELLEFKNTPNVYEPALYILQHTQNPTAKFHACSALVFSIFKEFDSIHDISPYIQTLIVHSLSTPDLRQFWVRRTLNSAACLIKRAYLNSPQLAWQCITSLLQMEQNKDSFTHKNMVFFLLKSILLVFSDSKISISFDFHYQCQSHFQSNTLEPFLKLLSNQILEYLHLAQSNATLFSDTSFPTLMNTLFNCLELMLHWDFSLLTPSNPTLLPTMEFAPLHFPSSWHAYLVSDTFINMLFEWVLLLPSSMLFSLTQCILAVASVPSIPDPPSYCSLLLQGSIQCVSQLATPSAFSLELLTLIHGTAHRLVLHFDLPLLLSLPTFSELLTKLSTLAFTCISNHSNSDDLEQCREEVISEIFSMWARIASRALQLNMENKLNTDSLAQIAQLSNPIVHCFLQDKQQFMNEEDFDIEDETLLKDWDTYASLLLDIGMLCRLDPTTNANFLLTQFHSLLQRFHQADSKVQILLLEGLHWLVMVTACFLADSNDHEISQIPYSIYQCPSFQPIQTCCQCIFQLLQPPVELSPLVMTTILWAIQRISASYICVVKEDYTDLPTHWTVFDAPFFSSTLSFLYQLLIKWRTEPEVLSQLFTILETCLNLPPQRHVLIHSDSFIPLSQTFLSFFHSLPEVLGQKFITFIVRAATFQPDPTLLQYIETTTTDYLTQVSKSGVPIDTWLKTLEFVDGIASSVNLSNAPLLLNLLTKALNAILSKPLPYEDLFSPLLFIFLHLFDDDFLYLETTALFPLFQCFIFLLEQIRFTSSEEACFIPFLKITCLFAESTHLEVLNVCMHRISLLGSLHAFVEHPSFLNLLVQLNTTLLKEHGSATLSSLNDVFCSLWCQVLSSGTSEHIKNALQWVVPYHTCLHRLPNPHVLQLIFQLLSLLSNLEEVVLWVNTCKFLFQVEMATMLQFSYEWNGKLMEPMIDVLKEFFMNPIEDTWQSYEEKLCNCIFNLSKCGLLTAVF